MAMPALDTITTIEQLMALPESNSVRHELLDGVHVVTPTPRLVHQRAVMELFFLIREALGDRNDLEVFPVPGDIKLNDRTVVEPDLFIIHRPPISARHWFDVGLPVLVAEILSPSTASRDRGVKRRLYQSAGVAEYWIVDLDARIVERWTPTDQRPEVVNENLAWSLAGGANGEINVQAYFRCVLGE